MKVTTLRIPEETYSELEAEAEARGLSVSEHIREVIARRDGGEPRENTGENTPDEGTVPVECDKCGYSWDYAGGMARATCPSCGAKVHV